MTAALDRKPGREAGERRKDVALALLESHRELYVLRGRRALLAALLERGAATADDIREVVRIPDRLNPKLFGSVPKPLARAGIIRAAGFERTCRPTAHARPLTRWELIDRDAALRWLADHPDRLAPDDDGPAGGDADSSAHDVPAAAPDTTTPAADGLSMRAASL